MGREQMSHWFHQRHVPGEMHWHVNWSWIIDLLKAQWVILVLLLTGCMALITGILIAWPVLAYLAAKLFG